MVSKRCSSVLPSPGSAAFFSAPARSSRTSSRLGRVFGSSNVVVSSSFAPTTFKPRRLSFSLMAFGERLNSFASCGMASRVQPAFLNSSISLFSSSGFHVL